MNVSANVWYSQPPRGSLYSCPARSGCGSAAAWVRHGCGTRLRHSVALPVNTTSARGLQRIATPTGRLPVRTHAVT